MSEVTTAPVEEKEQKGTNPQEFLSSIPNAPTAEQINVWKAQTPNNRVRIFTPDMKRVYLLRGISALELEGVQNSIPQNTSPDKVETVVHRAIVSRACLWTNTTASNKLADIDLSSAGAGLTPALFEVISILSDFIAPTQLEQLSADL